MMYLFNMVYLFNTVYLYNMMYLYNTVYLNNVNTTTYTFLVQPLLYGIVSLVIYPSRQHTSIYKEISNLKIICLKYINVKTI